jgi:hypothetical protein
VKSFGVFHIFDMKNNFNIILQLANCRIPQLFTIHSSLFTFVEQSSTNPDPQKRGPFPGRAAVHRAAG